MSIAHSTSGRRHCPISYAQRSRPAPAGRRARDPAGQAAASSRAWSSSSLSSSRRLRPTVRPCRANGGVVAGQVGRHQLQQADHAVHGRAPVRHGARKAAGRALGPRRPCCSWLSMRWAVVLDGAPAGRGRPPPLHDFGDVIGITQRAASPWTWPLPGPGWVPDGLVEAGNRFGRGLSSHMMRSHCRLGWKRGPLRSRGEGAQRRDLLGL